MSEQIGFNWNQQALEGEPIPEELPVLCPKCDGTKAGEYCSTEVCERPLFDDFVPVKKAEPEIPWTQYVRMVQMFFDGPKFEEFKAQISKLAVQYGTKNLTDTVAEAVKREAR